MSDAHVHKRWAVIVGALVAQIPKDSAQFLIAHRIVSAGYVGSS